MHFLWCVIHIKTRTTCFNQSEKNALFQPIKGENQNQSWLGILVFPGLSNSYMPLASVSCFSRARQWRHVSLTSSDWFTALYVFAVIGQLRLPLNLVDSITVQTKTDSNYNHLPEFIPGNVCRYITKWNTARCRLIFLWKDVTKVLWIYVINSFYKLQTI